MSDAAPTVARRFNLSLVQGVLAILLIISLVIGLASLYARLSANAGGGELHATAVRMANLMADEIREQADPRSNYETRMGITCQSKLAQQDAVARAVSCWQELVTQQLPNGSSHIRLDDSTEPPNYVIVVSWSEPGNGTASYVTRVARHNTKTVADASANASASSTASASASTSASTKANASSAASPSTNSASTTSASAPRTGSKPATPAR